MTARYDYRSWDGSQEGFGLDPEDLLAELTDEVLAGGDFDDALRRLMRTGMRAQTVSGSSARASSSSGSVAGGPSFSSAATPTASCPGWPRPSTR